MFFQTNTGEVILPKNLEVIPGDTFSDSVIKEELILPDSIKVIGDAAFNFGQIYSHARNWSTDEVNEEYLNNHTIHITKLPSSLEYLGNDAFWGDYGLTADLNSPRLEGFLGNAPARCLFASNYQGAPRCCLREH